MALIFVLSTNKSQKWLIRVFCSSRVVYCDHICWNISYFVHIDWNWRIVLSVNIVVINTEMRDMICSSILFQIKLYYVYNRWCVIYLSGFLSFQSASNIDTRKLEEHIDTNQCAVKQMVVWTHFYISSERLSFISFLCNCPGGTIC